MPTVERSGVPEYLATATDKIVKRRPLPGQEEAVLFENLFSQAGVREFQGLPDDAGLNFLRQRTSKFEQSDALAFAFLTSKVLNILAKTETTTEIRLALGILKTLPKDNIQSDLITRQYVNALKTQTAQSFSRDRIDILLEAGIILSPYLDSKSKSGTKQGETNQSPEDLRSQLSRVLKLIPDIDPKKIFLVSKVKDILQKTKTLSK